jgi:predicted RNA-binding Zn-ribbon protein involved in translation (DUF1610 family)
MERSDIVERCSVCENEIRSRGQKGYEPLTVDEVDNRITLQHCPHCGTLLVHIQTIPVHSR